MEKYNIEDTPMPAAAEPPAAFGHGYSHRSIPDDCMSVDEFFDELFEEIQKEYARIRGGVQPRSAN